MNTDLIFAQCEAEGISLKVNGDLLDVSFDLPPSQQLISMLKEHKQQIINVLKQYESSGQTQQQITKIDRTEDLYPVHNAQKRMWLIDKIENGSANYNMPIAIEINGKFDVVAASNALNDIVARHEILRSNFIEKDEDVFLSITDARHVNIELYERFGQDKNTIDSLVSALFSVQFDLAKDMLLKASYILTGEDNQEQGILVFVMHHIISDAWSMNVLTQEFTTLYQHYASGEQDQAAPLPSVDIQYLDYINWYRQSMDGDKAKKQLQYWLAQLANAPTTHSLPLDYVRNNQRQVIGKESVFQLDGSIAHGLKQLSQDKNMTVFMLVHAALALVVSKFSGHSDIVIGAPIANRLNDNTEQLIGLFVNTLALRTNTEFAQIDSYLEHVKSVNIDGMSNQDVQFDQVLDYCKVKRNEATSPLFQIVLSVNTLTQQGLELPDIELAPWSSDVKVAKFDLDLTVDVSDKGVNVNWLYNAAIFSQSTIALFQDALATVLQQMSNYRNDAPLSELYTSNTNALIEKQQSKQVTSLEGKSIVSTFQQQVLKNPNATALEFGAEFYSYQELDQLSDRLALNLQESGVTEGTLVAIAAVRSCELIVAMLATLKVGAGYVPLDPEYPQERLEFMLKDANAQHILVDDVNALPKVLTADTTLHEIELWQLEEQIQSQGLAALQSTVTPGEVAYVMYTSGSTGMPKGVMVSHGNVLRSTVTDPLINITDQSCVAYCANPSFDASTWEIWATLLNGARLLIVAQDELLDAQQFKARLQFSGASIVQLTAGLFKQYASVLTETFAGLDYLLVGGDKIDVAVAEQVVETCKPKHFIHTYGPTETVAFITQHEITKESIAKGNIPIGKPMANSQAYILDKEQNVLPFGAVGELYLGGDGVALGYLNREELTAQQFIDNPFGAGRLYRTGDLARYHADGNIEFLGRYDEQVKIRGFRIELGEIEHALSKSVSVASSVAVVQEHDQGKRLIGYVEAAVGHKIDVEQLRGELREHLPEHMQPSLLVEVQSWPLTPNGKVDRKSLPIPESGVLSGAYVEPESEVETQLQLLWSDLLQLPVSQVSVTASFFELGGDSILSIQLVSRAAKQGIHFSVKNLFDAPTIRLLSKEVKTGRLLDAPQGSIDGDIVLLPVQQGLLSDKTDWHHVNQAVMLETPASFDSACLIEMITALYKRHDALRLQFSDKTGSWIGTHRALDQALIESAVDVRTKPAGGWEALTEEANLIQTSLKPEDGEIVKATYWSGDESERGRLLMVIHHLAVDGVSWRILLDDLSVLYEQWLTGKPLSLSEKTSSYQQWGRFLKAYASSDDLAKEHQYWLEQADNNVDTLRLQEHNASLHQAVPAQSIEYIFKLSKEMTSALLTTCQKAFDAQMNELLLAALAGGMRKSGVQQFRVDMEGHGREPIAEGLDISQTVGWFSSSYPMLLNLCGAQDSFTMIEQVKKDYRRIPNKGIGFSVLKQYADMPAISAVEASEICFNYLGQFDAAQSDSSLFTFASESSGVNQSTNRKRLYPLSFKALIHHGELECSLSYCESEYSKELIAEMMREVSEYLNAFAEIALSQHLGQDEKRRPSTKVENMVIALLADITGLQDSTFELDQPILNMLGDESLMFTLLNRLSRQGYSGVGLDTFKTHFSIELLAQHLGAIGKTETGSARSLVNLNKWSNATPLYMLHPFSGRVNCYHQLATEVSEVAQVIGIQAPYIYDHELRFENIGELASYYVEAIKAHQPTGPYRLGGWSAGAQVAYYVAYELLKGGDEVEYLVMLDPMLPQSEPLTSVSEFMKYLAAFAGVTLQNIDAGIDDNALQGASKEQVIASVADVILSANVPGLDSIDRIKTMLYAGLDYREAYRPQVSLGSDIKTQLVVASTRDDIEQYQQQWQTILEHNLETVVIQGEHEELLTNTTSFDAFKSLLSEDLKSLDKQNAC
ncbi:non-ribosomal peptide synthetase [Pseudoalteromonas umbrosa]|uniref:non-ribosomal peptide synthetase n=1 Tax=Pseudoalteromonas umbrosa TaxID=3048489 RepID=UPI0024C23776|nr:non-ribosomal peptide synthetase [Pseudoalteromonas sp. B95]MDK1288853.1 amino acid adenylation domain-containing protein [Pseudoalteromonas sp. B95]